ncbi:hypothetical protein FJZ17_04395 [Candidatus Pacearchaeota archaeon]|nr:hypothetical protein [Candidatus Pacearchaeota archaeon]
MESEPIYLKSLKEGLKELRIADHMLYITQPILRDKRILLSSIDKIYEAIKKLITAFLQYDYLNKKIQIHSDSRINFETFMIKTAPRYGISNQETEKIREIVDLAESHKKSPLEFTRREKVVIMSGDLSTKQINPDKLKDYLFLTKNLFRKAQIILA